MTLYKKFLNIFGLSMALIYIAMGIFLLIKPDVFAFTGFTRYGLGVLLLLYGLFRLYQLIRNRDRDLENDEEKP